MIVASQKLTIVFHAEFQIDIDLVDILQFIFIPLTWKSTLSGGGHNCGTFMWQSPIDI